MMKQWVVTYRIKSDSGVMLAEFFRGSHQDCVRICAHHGGGEDDSQKTEQPWEPILGTAHSWDKFLRDN